MNKNILWGSLAVVLVVVLVWSFSMSGGKTDEGLVSNDTSSQITSSTGTNTVKTSKPVKAAPTETFTNLLPKVGNYQCDYIVVTQSTKTTNTVYLSDGKMRGEFRTTQQNGDSTSSLIVYDGTNIYTWTEGKSVGTVMRPKSLNDFPAIIPKDLLASKSLGSGLFNASWSCHPWSVDKTMLAKPSYLKV